MESYILLLSKENNSLTKDLKMKTVTVTTEQLYTQLVRELKAVDCVDNLDNWTYGEQNVKKVYHLGLLTEIDTFLYLGNLLKYHSCVSFNGLTVHNLTQTISRYLFA